MRVYNMYLSQMLVDRGACVEAPFTPLAARDRLVSCFRLLSVLEHKVGSGPRVCSGSVFSHVRCREKIGIQACDTICVIRIMVSPRRVYIRFACTRTARTYANLRELTYANLHELVKSMDDSSV